MPAFGVAVAIIQNGQVLLTKRRDFPLWCLPGGVVEAGESLARAAVREAREETGLEVTLTRLVGLYSRPNWQHGGAHEIVFAARPTGGGLQRATDETVDAHYFDVGSLPDTLMWWYHRRVRDALDRTAAVARTQDAVWPLGEMTRQDLYRLRDQGGISLQTLFEELCGPARPERETLDVGVPEAGEQ